MHWFIEQNRRLSVFLGRSSWKEPDLQAYRDHPFSWMWLLIPICGMVFLYAVGHEANINRRYRELEARRQARINKS